MIKLNFSPMPRSLEWREALGVDVVGTTKNPPFVRKVLGRKRLTDLASLENRAGLTRITCGWKKDHLPMDVVRRYWRDVHSPAIARRDGVFDYRQCQLDDVDPRFFGTVADIDFTCPLDAQLMWQSDVRYADEKAMQAFAQCPDAVVRSQLLADIDIIVDRSTTYKAVGENTKTVLDRTGVAAPQGKPPLPSFCVFFRQRSDEASFRAALRDLCEQWARIDGVARIRLNLFDRPDMEAEKKAGYPIKTHPPEQQYQAFVELVVDTTAVGRSLLAGDLGRDLARHVEAIHAYPVAAVYTFVYGGAPTLVGLRGYPAYDAIEALNAVNQQQPTLLAWMFGPVAQRERVV